MNIPLFQVDAFASEPFTGNPAAVCPLQTWLPDSLMQNIAMENNLSETAFFVKGHTGYRLRWFTPTAEVDLCGHATLAAAHVLFSHLNFPGDEIHFESNSGPLHVRRANARLVMDFPSAKLNKTEVPEALKKGLGTDPEEVFKDTDYLYVLKNEKRVKALDPDFQSLKQVDTRGIIVTAPADGEDIDFISRFFGPAVGVDEDPVTGSAHTMLTPYWSRRLGKEKLTGRQISRRGGTVYCEQQKDRVILSGYAQTYLTGEIEV